jgi:cell wall assembly regulator SMI1
MASSIGATFRSFWHTMTSNDRHAGIDSPYRTGRHVPLNNGDTLTSVATASDSRNDVSSPYFDENRRRSRSPTDGYSGSPYTPSSPGQSRPYSPGLRSASAQRSSSDVAAEIQMQPFEDGQAPAPPVQHSWQRIDTWAEENYPELFDQLCEGATGNDLNETEHMLDISLPQDVRESLMIHDGQERGGRPTGIIFGSMLLDCEEMVQEWENWRKVNQEFLFRASQPEKPAVPSKTFGGSSQASSSKAPPSPAPSGPNPGWRQDLASRQDCVPANAIKKMYAHQSWIPLVRDWGGNNLAVDLSPGPAGRWGQIIMFGRDYDTKYVVARSWAHFLAMVADDLNSGKWFVDEENHELKLREFKDSRVEPAYFSILRWRMDQKYGRRAPPNAKRRSVMSPPRRTSPTSSRSVSPYASPVEPSTASPLQSATRLGFPKPSPLSQVAEENGAGGGGSGALSPGNSKPNKLVEVDTPRPSEDANALKLSSFAPTVPSEVSPTVSNGKEKEKDPQDEALAAAASATATPTEPAEEADDGMKTIDI